MRAGLTLGLLAVAGLAACQPMPVAGVSRDTLARCVSAAGVTGDFSTTYTLVGNRQTETVLAGGSVSAEQASIANDCITGSADSPLPGPVQAAFIPEPAPLPVATPPAPAYTPAPTVARSCSLTMVGGTSYVCRPVRGHGG